MLIGGPEPESTGEEFAQNSLVRWDLFIFQRGSMGRELWAFFQAMSVIVMPGDGWMDEI